MYSRGLIGDEEQAAQHCEGPKSGRVTAAHGYNDVEGFTCTERINLDSLTVYRLSTSTVYSTGSARTGYGCYMTFEPPLFTAYLEHCDWTPCMHSAAYIYYVGIRREIRKYYTSRFRARRVYIAPAAAPAIFAVSNIKRWLAGYARTRAIRQRWMDLCSPSFSSSLQSAVS